MKKLLLVVPLLLFFLLIFGQIAFAQPIPVPQNDPNAININLQPQGVPQAPSIQIEQIISWVISLLIGIGVLIAFIFLLLGAIQWIMSGGDKQKLETARGHLVAAIVGLIILLLAIVIFNFIGKLLNIGNLTNFSIPTITGDAGTNTWNKANQ